MKRNENILYFDYHTDFPVIVKGKGAYLYDEDGKCYLEACGGSISNSLGYGREDMAEVLKKQAEEISFAYRHHVSSQALNDAADALKDAFPAMDKFFMCSGGSEATELATKIARLHFYDKGQPSKNRIISRWMSYHGYTEGALSYGGHFGRRKEFAPILREDGHIPPAYCYRCWYGKDCGSCQFECAHALEDAILAAGPENVAAYICEPIVGSALAGVPAPEGYFEVIREICDKYDVLLIVDEVMCGSGRTGKMSAMEQYGVQPDIIAMAKALGGGYLPVGAVGMTKKVAKPIEDYGIFPCGHTWAGNPMACSVLVKTMQIIKDEKLLENVNKVGAYFREELEKLAERIPYIGDVRGMGLMQGIEFVKDRKTKECFPPSCHLGHRLFVKCMENGMIVMDCTNMDKGQAGDALLLGPCYEYTMEQVDETIRILEKSILEVFEDIKDEIS